MTCNFPNTFPCLCTCPTTQKLPLLCLWRLFPFLHHPTPPCPMPASGGIDLDGCRVSPAQFYYGSLSQWISTFSQSIHFSSSRHKHPKVRDQDLFCVYVPRTYYSAWNIIGAHCRFIECVKDRVYMVSQGKYLRSYEEQPPSETGMPLVPERVSNEW